MLERLEAVVARVADAAAEATRIGAGAVRFVFAEPVLIFGTIFALGNVYRQVRSGDLDVGDGFETAKDLVVTLAVRFVTSPYFAR